MMRQGGNGQIREFYKKLQIENSPITILYSTKGASHYRDRLKERADKVTNYHRLVMWLRKAIEIPILLLPAADMYSFLNLHVSSLLY